MFRLFIASLIAAAALCVFFSGPRREFQPVALVPVPAAVALPPSTYGLVTSDQFLAAPRAPEPVMAVPKKRTSRMKTRSRKANWFAKGRRQAALAWNRYKSLKLDPRDVPYVTFDDDEKSDDEDDEEEETSVVETTR
jgi:hypothetical protein